ncbi:hypothetical protein GCM10010343_29020 [Streptomyces avidinii]|nr:hypothetical protein GCM10010343_29020 [Streptomyces avidinii]
MLELPVCAGWLWSDGRLPARLLATTSRFKGLDPCHGELHTEPPVLGAHFALLPRDVTRSDGKGHLEFLP